MMISGCKFLLYNALVFVVFTGSVFITSGKLASIKNNAQPLKFKI